MANMICQNLLMLILLPRHGHTGLMLFHLIEAVLKYGHAGYAGISCCFTISRMNLAMIPVSYNRCRLRMRTGDITAWLSWKVSPCLQSYPLKDTEKIMKGVFHNSS